MPGTNYIKIDSTKFLASKEPERPHWFSEKGWHTNIAAVLCKLLIKGIHSNWGTQKKEERLFQKRIGEKKGIEVGSQGKWLTTNLLGWRGCVSISFKGNDGVLLVGE